MPFPRPNRPRESRYRTLTGQQLAWCDRFSVRAFSKGWLLDVSRSGPGPGLMIERDKLPRAGESIDVRLKPAADPVPYRVVRIQGGTNKIVVVGCERMDGRAAGLDLPEPAWAMSHAT